MYAYVYTHAQSLNNKTLNCFGVDQKRIMRRQQQQQKRNQRKSEPKQKTQATNLFWTDNFLSDFFSSRISNVKEMRVC